MKKEKRIGGKDEKGVRTKLWDKKDKEIKKHQKLNHNENETKNI